MTKLKPEMRKHLQEARDEFLKTMRDRINIYIWTGNVDAFDRLLTQVEILGKFELVNAVLDKGLAKDWEKLLDKAGQIVVDEKREKP